MNFDKLRISVLWLLAIAAFFGFVTLVKDEVPAILSNISLHSSQEVGSLSAVLMLFTVLSLILKGSINRWTNIIAGTIIGIGTFIAFVDAVTENLYGYYNLMIGTVWISMFLIVWFAYKMPKVDMTQK